ncbi:g5600 [Coccomyxa viridis]|uniref:G5600 protein n=1 Tax=Coccomyxa viridis TaxID=1274662 RepID=A0ABP1FT75_9CHLO
MHISMCIKGALQAGPNAEIRCLLVVLDRLMSLICADGAQSSQFLRAVHKALPRLLECLLKEHKWPTGSDEDLEWLGQAMRLLRQLLMQHARRARDQGTPLDQHIGKILAFPGLQEVEAELLVAMFKDFWADKTWEPAPLCPTAALPNQASSASPNATPTDSSTGAGKRVSQAKAKVAAESGSSIAKACNLSQHSDNGAADVAADVLGGVSEKAGDCQGDCKPAQSIQEPQSSPSEAEKRKAKKARRRAARAQAAAQTAEVKGMGGEEPALAESRADVSLQERSAETEGAQQPPEAVQSSIDPVLESPKETAHLSEVAASSTSPSLSPQPLQQLHEWASHEQLAQVVPSRAAPAAQAAAPAAQNDGTWQEPPRPQPTLANSMSHRPLQASTDSTSQDGDHAAPQRMLDPPEPEIFSHEHAAHTNEGLSGEDNQQGDYLCVVCMENARKIVFCDCGHLCTCQGCAADIMAAGALCPMCRASIKGTFTVYF